MKNIISDISHDSSFNDSSFKKLKQSIGFVELNGEVKETDLFIVTTDVGDFECDNETDAHIVSLLEQINERLKRVEKKL